jgi:hypothetical protein
VVGRHEVEFEDVAHSGGDRAGLEVEGRGLGLVGHGCDGDDVVIGNDPGREAGKGKSGGPEGHHCEKGGLKRVHCTEMLNVIG